MNRQAFHQLLNRYLAGTCSEEERRLIDQWYDLLDEETPLSISEADLQLVEKRIWDKINPLTGDLSPKESYRLFRRIRPARWIAAAALAGTLIAGIYLFASRSGESNSIVSEKVAKGLMEVKNGFRGVKQVRLEDGSVVILQPNANIAFPKHFYKDKREVYLEGEAFFEVAKNAARPFFVYNNNLVAEVLGTSFNVKIINNKIEVAVKTGRVAVYENGLRINMSPEQKKENGVIIMPNQKVTYYEENRHFITSLVDAPLPVHTENGKSAGEEKFVFDDTPLSEVLNTLEKTYQIEIVLENVNLANCPFTGNITKQTLFNKLEIICQAFQATYDLKGTVILIKGGNGCN
jgi:transmembrane sensor